MTTDLNELGKPKVEAVLPSKAGKSGQVLKPAKDAGGASPPALRRLGHGAGLPPAPEKKIPKGLTTRGK
jgi:hypothetical protein